MPKISCPSCGAPVDFKAGASILAVCEYCRSTLVRHDVNVEDIGKMAELKVDGSPLQIGAQGRYRGMNFGIIGRIQLRYDRGIWNEWHVMFDDGRTAWLGEAQGIYAVSFLTQITGDVPTFESLRAGRKLQLKGQWFEVQDLESARCVAGEGELPFKVGAGYDAPVADLVADKNGFATIDYSETPPLVFIGEYMEFDDLHFSNLRQFDGWS
jgi:hypothetical protein